MACGPSKALISDMILAPQTNRACSIKATTETLYSPQQQSLYIVICLQYLWPACWWRSVSHMLLLLLLGDTCVVFPPALCSLCRRDRTDPRASLEEFDSFRAGLWSLFHKTFAHRDLLISQYFYQKDGRVVGKWLSMNVKKDCKDCPQEQTPCHRFPLNCIF